MAVAMPIHLNRSAVTMPTQVNQWAVTMPTLVNLWVVTMPIQVNLWAVTMPTQVNLWAVSIQGLCAVLCKNKSKCALMTRIQMEKQRKKTEQKQFKCLH